MLEKASIPGDTLLRTENDRLEVASARGGDDGADASGSSEAVTAAISEYFEEDAESVLDLANSRVGNDLLDDLEGSSVSAAEEEK